MFGILLASLGTLFEEAGSSLGKVKNLAREQTIYTMGFLQTFGGLMVFALFWLWNRQTFLFSAASLPTFIPRVILEIVQAHVTMIAIAKADRSTFGFVRVITIPLLLAADILLGYHIQNLQIVGICFMITALLIVFTNHGIQKKAIGYVLFSGINAAVTLSLYKYNISHFNSVVAEQMIVYVALVVYFLAAAWLVAKENPLRFLTRPAFFAQAATLGAGSLVGSFAFMYAPASIILAAMRSSTIFWTTVSGRIYFKEQHILIKLFTFALLLTGLILLFV
jgi:drug/metabolite transporter (DMT)-like permease